MSQRLQTAAEAAMDRLHRAKSAW